MGTGTVALPISSLVNVQVSVAAAAAQAQNTTSMLLLTNNNVIDMTTRLMKFSSLDDVGAAFGTSSVEYAVATLWFGQIPQPTDILIGKWAKTASPGLLQCGNLSSTEQQMALWTSITAGNFKIGVNAAAAVNVGPLNFSTQTNLNGVAATIQTALATATSGAATCTWDGNNFIFSTAQVGPAASVSFLTPGTASDISAQLKGQSSSPGAYTVAGAAAETAENALALFDLQFGYQWYAVMVPQASDADQLQMAEQVQGMSTKHFFGCTTQDPNTLTAPTIASTDLAYLLSKQALTKAAVQYSSSSPYAVASLLARILTTDYTQNNSVITLMYKQEPGVTSEYLNRTQLDAVMQRNCNVFVAYQGGALIIQPGTTCSTNQFIDSIIGLDNLAIDLQMALFNLLYTSATKVPQTDAGMNQLVGAADNVLLQYVADGLLAPGTWTDAGFGKMQSGSYLEKGYYIYCPPLAMQSQADRAARMAGPIKIAVKLAGAIHTVNAQIVVNP